MSTKNVLAVDYGGSSGRTILGKFNGSVMEIEETHRFANEPVPICGTLYWDTLRLLHETRQGLAKSYAIAPFDSVGLDSWGVDYGLLDANGRLLENPVHYRDSRTNGIPEKVAAICPDLYEQSGIQDIWFNTVYQLYATVLKYPALLERTDRLLYTPDLLAYFLTGEKATEYSMASTSALMVPGRPEWNKALCKKLGIPDRIFGPIVDPGLKVGPLLPETMEQCGITDPVDYIAICSHDTASAVAAVPCTDEDLFYISSGTWSLMGVERKTPLINEATKKANLTNEGGYGRTVRFLKNIAGMWLLQQCRKQWQKEHLDVDYGSLAAQAKQAVPFRSLIDPDDDLVTAPGNMPRRIADYCAAHGEPVPQSVGETLRCIYDSLALRYRSTMRTLEQLNGMTYPAIHIVGGGSQDKIMSQMTADACNRPVICGPVEATAIGNLSVQLIASGELASITEAREMVARSFSPVTYLPQNTEGWDEAEERFFKVIGK